MEMTIETSLEWLTSRKEHYEMDDNCQELAKALDVAIDTMHKYQKIEKIIDDWNNQKINNIICCLDIKEVIENGNN